MVRDGKLAKVEEPTDWCSNMTVVETNQVGRLHQDSPLSGPKSNDQQGNRDPKVHCADFGRKFCRRWELTSTSASLS